MTFRTAKMYFLVYSHSDILRMRLLFIFHTPSVQFRQPHELGGVEVRLATDHCSFHILQKREHLSKPMISIPIYE